MPVELMPRIVVVGVGGAGGNAVENMIKTGLQGVEFVVANTDSQALSRSSAPVKLQLGVTRTAGLGAGANPEVGAEAAKESHDDIKKLLHGAHMCFIAAGMGGGTGTGAAPIIARMAKEQKVLTVGVVTKPFDFEGKRRMQVAEKGIAELRGEVDTLIVIPNQNLMRVANRQTTFVQAFEMADDVLRAGVRGITDLMVMPGLINLDFADVRTVMAGMGTAMMGQGEAEGENRALAASRAAITNPLLDDVSLKGAKGVIINITGGYDMTLFEVDEAANEIRREVDVDGHIILGSTFDENMAGKIRVSVVAAGIAQNTAAQNTAAQNTSAWTSAIQNAPVQPAAIQPVARPSVRDMLYEAAAPSPVQQPEPAPLYQPPHMQPPHQPSPQQLTEAFAPPPPQAPAPLPPLFPTAPAATSDAPRATPVIRRPTPIEDSLMPQRDELELVQRAPQEPLVQAGHPPHEPPGPVPGQMPGRSFSSLFGWKKPAPESPAATASAPAADEAFDDELEIPAFLRRSANN